MEAITAIDGLVATGLERNLGLVATIRASRCVQLACFAWCAAAATKATTRLAGGAARWATARRIGQPVALVKFLLAYGKDEFLVAVAAN